MLNVGQLLKNKRSERGVSLRQVSQATKIPVKLLGALENGNYDVFSSEIYLKGFLKNYAKFLGVDTQKAMAIYRRERKSIKEDENFQKAGKGLDDPKPFVTPARLVFALTAVIVIGVITFVAVQVNKIIKPPFLELSEPIAVTAPGDGIFETEGDSVSLAGKVEVGSKLFINGSEVTTNNLQEFKIDNYQLKPGSNEINIIAESYYFSKTSQITLTVISKLEEDVQVEEEQEAENQNTHQEGSVDEVMNVQIEIGPENAWIVIGVDDEQVVTETALAGSDYTFKAFEKFTIYSPKPQMVSLNINDNEYNFSAQAEAVFKLEKGKIVQE